MPSEGKSTNEVKSTNAEKVEQREHPRFEVTAYVDCAGREVLLYHKIENISLGGICLQSSAIEERGTVVELVINFPDLDTSVAVQGEVVWANHEPPSDMGIRYLNLDGERLETMRRYIALAKRGPGSTPPPRDPR